MNFAKFTGKHMRLSLAFNEAADLKSLSLSKKKKKKKKKNPTQLFSCEFCEISLTPFLKNLRS